MDANWLFLDSQFTGLENFHGKMYCGDTGCVSQSLQIPLENHRLTNKDTILVASWDPVLEAARKRVLESAGYEVLLARGSNGVRKVCEKRRVSLVVIGYSLPPSEKRRVWSEARAVCKTPILQLYRGSKPELMELTALFAHQTNAPDDFVRTVQDILQRNNQN